MTRILLLGLDPETVDCSDPALPPGMTAEKVRAGIAVAVKQFTDQEEQQTFPRQQFQGRLYFPPKSFTMPNDNRDRSGAVHQILDCLTPVCVGNEQASCTTETEIVSRTTNSNDGPHLGEHSSETLFVAALPQVNGSGAEGPVLLCSSPGSCARHEPAIVGLALAVVVLH